MADNRRRIVVNNKGVETHYCRKCGSRMEHRDTTHPNFSRGEYSETGGEFLQCTNKDCMITSDYPKMRVSDFKHCQPGF